MNKLKTMRKTFLIIALAAPLIQLFAQSAPDAVLKSVEQNNTTLKALRHTADAQKLENRTGIYLPGPEAGFDYLWSDPATKATRIDLSLTQSFDIPTISGMRSRLSDNRNASVEWQYLAGRRDILLEAKEACIDVIYYNALIREWQIRLSHAAEIAEAGRKRLAAGDINRLEYNNIEMDVVNARGELARAEAERTAVLSQLKRLNGGIPVTLSDTVFPVVILPASFDAWFAAAEQKNPEMAIIRQEAEISRNLVSLSRAERYPVLSAGYMSEKVGREQFQGITTGISIPLWENKNHVATAKAAALAAGERVADGRLQLLNHYGTLYEHAGSLNRIAADYREALGNLNSAALLKKALDAGQISVVEYLMQLSIYYNLVSLSLEAERDYQKAAAELMASDL